MIMLHPGLADQDLLPAFLGVQDMTQDPTLIHNTCITVVLGRPQNFHLHQGLQDHTVSAKAFVGANIH